MAAIDKLYVNTYYDFDQFRKWALIYNPKLILDMYDWDMTYSDYRRNKKLWIIHTSKIIKRDYKKLGKFSGFTEAVNNLIEHYKKSADYDCPKSQAISETKYIIKKHKQLENGTLGDSYSFPILNSRPHIDKYLKWHCPISFVREYLYNQCGVNYKWERLYKLFWKGTKDFR